jgi:hypothetical protein
MRFETSLPFTQVKLGGLTLWQGHPQRDVGGREVMRGGVFQMLAVRMLRPLLHTETPLNGTNEVPKTISPHDRFDRDDNAEG